MLIFSNLIKAKKSIFEPVKSIHKSKVKHLPINSKEYLNLDQSRIPEEEKIFYKYARSNIVLKLLSSVKYL
jgi:hypothetical protein